MTSTATAAYGFRIEALGPTPWLCLTEADELPILKYEPPRGYGWVAPDDESWAVHPGLTAVLMPLVIDSTDVMLHAGVLGIDGGAWIVVGRSGAGKTTLMYAAYRRGIEILCDDTAIIRDGFVLAGPRCLDLRVPVPDSQVVRGDRYRVTLDPVVWRMPIAGFVHLRWADDPTPPQMIELGTGARLAALVDEARGDAVRSQSAEMLDLVVWPAYELLRPKDADVEDVVAELETVIVDRGRRQPDHARQRVM